MIFLGYADSVKHLRILFKHYISPTRPDRFEDMRRVSRASVYHGRHIDAELKRRVGVL